mmetsp:Transcript_22795/g.65552  ORF Transcript_22795/g.65552 Transcript_22795/m.65552 type:complete len:628 (-) Transcript_22795:66-1949(-)
MWQQPGAVDGEGPETMPPAEMAPMAGANYGSVGGPGVAEGAPVEDDGTAPMYKAVRALGEVKSDLVVAGRDFPALLMPWALFCACMLPMALMKEVYLGTIAAALCLVLGLGFLLFSAGRSWQMLAVTCLAASTLGVLFGRYDRVKYLEPYFIYSRSPFFLNLLPSESPSVYEEAGYLRFSADSHVDTSRGLGYRSGGLWCVAPIVGAGASEISTTDAGQSVGFWAVGRNCCQERGLFRCGDVLQRQERGGLVVHDYTGTDDKMLPTYTLAAEAAAKTYGLVLPKDPIFVEWGRTPEDALEDMFSEASSFATTASLSFFGVVPLFALLLSLFGLSLTRRMAEFADKNWHVDKVAMMKYGIDILPQQYNREVQWDLLNMRCYWSGEIIYDYAFHVANKHMYLGCFLSHPAHPYTKLERFIVCTMVTSFITCMVAAISVAVGAWGYKRLILMVLVVTVPYNILKLYLIQIAQHDPARMMEEGQFHGPRRSLQWEIAFLSGCLLATVVTCAVCAVYIRSATELPLGDVLWSSCDAIAFAFILELLFDLAFPFIGLERCEGTWALGFFGRWRAERAAYFDAERDSAAADAEPSMARAVEASRGRPLFRSLGAEILTPGRGRQPSYRGRGKRA